MERQNRLEHLNRSGVTAERRRFGWRNRTAALCRDAAAPGVSFWPLAVRPGVAAAVFCVLWLLCPSHGAAQWVAYNDHSRGAGSPDGLNTTASNVTAYSVAAAGTAVGGPLTNFLTGGRITPNQAGVRILLSGRQDGTSGGSASPTNPASPAAMLFTGKVAWSNSSLYFGGSGGFATSEVRMTFTNLVPGRLYNFRGTAIRGGGYATRCSHVTLAGASNAVPAHRTGAGSPGIVTNGWAPYGDMLVPGTQAILNSGENRCGDVIGWDLIQPANGSNFSVICSNWTGVLPGGGTNSVYAYALSAIMLEEIAPVYIVFQPQSLSVCLGNPFSLSVTAAGSGNMGYQWQHNGTNLLGKTNSVCSVAMAAVENGGDYSVIITNILGAVTSDVAAVTISSTGIEILGQPQNTSALLGTPAVFSVGLNPDAASPNFQWYRNLVPENSGGTAIPGATGAQYTLPAAYESNAVYYYYVVVSNCVNIATSTVAALAITYAPIIITNQPLDAVVSVGSSTGLAVGVSGSVPRYQWFRGSDPIPWATNATLALTNIQFADSGYYSAVISNPSSSATSRLAVLAVSAPPYLLIHATNHVWSYRQDGVDLGTAWRGVAHDDTGWPTGRGVFGFESGNTFVQSLTNTVLSLTNLSGTTNTTIYFRTTFVLTNDPADLVLVTSNLVDDGHVVYLNGVEAYRSTNMLAGVSGYGAFARAPHQEGVWEVANLPSGLLVDGTNTLAVELHQNSLTSADAVFGFAAVVQYQTPSPILITNPPQSQSAIELKPVTFAVGYTGGAVRVWWFFQRTTNDLPEAIPWGRSPTLTITNPAFGVNDGLYFAVLSNTFEVVHSDVVTLTIRPDLRAPDLVDADGIAAPTQVLLTFDEPLLLIPDAPLLALTNPANYTVTNTIGEALTVISAAFTNGTNILLTTATPRLPDRNYIVTVAHAADISPRHNTSTNLVSPVSTLLRLVESADNYWFAQPISGIDPVDDFTNGVWKLPEYDPGASGAGWFYPGQSPFCFGNVVPPEPCGTSLSQGVVATFFRKPFFFLGSPAGLRGWMSHIVDDGAVFHLNGVEMHRFNMPTGEVTMTHPALTILSSPTLTGPVKLPRSQFLLGKNVLAVELHGGRVIEATLAFAMELQARVDSLVVGPVVLTTSPLDLTVAESEPAAFRFRAAGGAVFQWRSNGVDIAGATNDSYNIPNTPLSANGARFSVLIVGASNAIESGEAVLTVLPDTNAPVLLSAYLVAPDTISLSFSEPVSEATTTNLLNYAITNAVGPALPVVSIILTNATNALLQLGAAPAGSYTVVASDVVDRSTAGNPIAANSRVTVGVTDYPLVADGVTLWRYNDENFDLGTAWREVGYDDRSWLQGLGIFDGKWNAATAEPMPRANIAGEPVLTQLSATNATNPGRIPTRYFRATPVLPVFGPGAALSLRHAVDDGAAFYLNGQLLYSIRTVIPTTFGFGNVLSAAGDAVFEGPFSVPVTNLFPATNLLAAELKEQNQTSSDATFGAFLTLDVPSLMLPPGGSTNTVPAFPPRLRITRAQPDQIELSWTNNGPWLLQHADSVAAPGDAWITVTNPPNPLMLSVTNAPRFFRLKK